MIIRQINKLITAFNLTVKNGYATVAVPEFKYFCSMVIEVK